MNTEKGRFHVIRWFGGKYGKFNRVYGSSGGMSNVRLAIKAKDVAKKGI